MKKKLESVVMSKVLFENDISKNDNTIEKFNKTFYS